MNHSAFTYLISPDGKWKLLYNFDQLSDANKMVRDIEQVLAGALKNSRPQVDQAIADASVL